MNVDSIEIEVSVCVDIDNAVCEMCDIAEDLEKMLELVPSWQHREAMKIKTRIINKMVSWIDGKEKKTKA